MAESYKEIIPEEVTEEVSAEVSEEVPEEVPEEELSEIQTKIINAFGVYIENNTIFVSTDL